MNKGKIRISNVIKYAGAFAACAIGSGFATGQEIMQFFSAFGLPSLIGTLITTVIFTWCGATFMKHGFENKLKTPKDAASFYFGKKAGPVIEVVFQVFLFGVYSIMIAGAGATMSEYFGLSPVVGRIGMSVVAMLTVILGLQKFTDILGCLGPVIVIFAVVIGLISYLKDPAALLLVNDKLANLTVTKVQGGWFFSSLLYPAFNAIVVIFLSCCIVSNADSKEEATWGGIVGGVIFGLAIIIMNLGLMSNIDIVAEASVPTLILAGNILPIIATVFSVIICIGIYTTTVPTLWGIVRHFAADGTKKSIILTIVFSALGLLLGLTDFKVLVNTIYPFSGYVGLVLFGFMLYKDLKR